MLTLTVVFTFVVLARHMPEHHGEVVIRFLADIIFEQAGEDLLNFFFGTDISFGDFIIAGFALFGCQEQVRKHFSDRIRGLARLYDLLDRLGQRRRRRRWAHVLTFVMLFASAVTSSYRRKRVAEHAKSI